MEAIILYGFLVLYGILRVFLWILICSKPRVLLGIHPNHRYVESWVSKTLIHVR